MSRDKDTLETKDEVFVDEVYNSLRIVDGGRSNSRRFRLNDVVDTGRVIVSSPIFVTNLYTKSQGRTGDLDEDHRGREGRGYP